MLLRDSEATGQVSQHIATDSRMSSSGPRKEFGGRMSKWQEIWVIEVRKRNGRTTGWQATGMSWYMTRRDCNKAIGEIEPINWETYFYRPAKYVNGGADDQPKP